MKQGGLVVSFLRDTSGAAFIEFTVVFPLTAAIILGTVDATLLMFDWASATKATYAGAREAIVNDPVANSARFLLSSYTTQATYSGHYCFNSADGSANAISGCPGINVKCTGDITSAGGTCTTGTFNKVAFNNIFNKIQGMYPYRTLDRRQVQVSYVTTNLGFVGQESFAGGNGELPLNVTVQLRCITHQFFFLQALIGWTFSDLAAACNGITTGTEDGIAMPPFNTTLPSEDLAAN